MAEQPGMASRIAELALQRFRIDGFAGTSVADLAIALGVSKAAIYYHYRSKTALLHRLVDPLLDAIDTCITSHTTPSGERNPRGLLTDYLATLTAHQDRVVLVATDTAVINHPEIGARIHTQNQQLRALLVGEGATPPAILRAEAALGALWRPLVAGPEVSVTASAHQQTLIDAAMAALDTMDTHVPSPDRQPLG